MTTTRAALREELTARLIPRLRASGFEGPRAIAGNELFHDFRRKVGDVTQVLSVQLEKGGLPRFILSLAIEPADGFDALVSRGGTLLQGRLQPKRGATTRFWFRADPPLWRKLLGQTSTHEVAAVESCVALLPEVETWWKTQASSAHISVLPITYPGTSSARRA